MAKKSKIKKPRAKGEYSINEIRTARGEKMLKGPWRLISPHMLEFPAALIDTRDYPLDARIAHPQ